MLKSKHSTILNNWLFFLSLWQITLIIIIFVLIPKYFAHKQLCQQIHCNMSVFTELLGEKKVNKQNESSWTLNATYYDPMVLKIKQQAEKKSVFILFLVHTNIVYQVHTVCVSREGEEIVLDCIVFDFLWFLDVIN